MDASRYTAEHNTHFDCWLENMGNFVIFNCLASFSKTFLTQIMMAGMEMWFVKQLRFCIYVYVCFPLKQDISTNATQLEHCLQNRHKGPWPH